MANSRLVVTQIANEPKMLHDDDNDDDNGDDDDDGDDDDAENTNVMSDG